MTRCWLPIALVPAVLACGEAEDPPTGPAIPQGHAPSSKPPANVVGGLSIQLPDTTLAPGEESFPCFIFPIELEGDSHIVGGGRLTTPAGMHHGNITTRPATGTGVRPCPADSQSEIGAEADDLLAGGVLLFASSTQVNGEEWQSFPDGMGFPLVTEGFEIVAHMHYLNVSTEEVTIAPRYDWFTIDESTVTHVLGGFAWIMDGYEIPPLSKKTVTTTCYPDNDMHVVNALPHMHALGREFFGAFEGGELDGQRWLDSQGYNPDGVITQFTPAVDLSLAEGVQFGCTWQNTFNKTIKNGTGDDEMCILFGYAYPYENAYSAYASEGGCVMLAPPPPGGD